MNIPNILTIFRLFAALVIGWPFLFLVEQAAAWVSLMLFAFASITDFLDGYLARKWNQTSELGRMLDPIADKILVLMMLAVTLGVLDMNWLLLLPTSVIFFREVLVSGMREFLGDRAKALQVTKIAKWKTAAQMIALCVILFSIAIHSDILIAFGVTLLWIAMVLTAISGIDYARKALKLLEA